VTESTNDAGRIYRKAGFIPDLETVTVYKSPTIENLSFGAAFS
jgi:hypothetical protein